MQSREPLKSEDPMQSTESPRKPGNPFNSLGKNEINGAAFRGHRTIIYISLNRTSNHITKFNRPEHIAHRDFDPITCLDDNCLK